jgi:cutinase
MKKILTLLGTLLIVTVTAVGIAFAAVSGVIGVASADPCTGVWSIGVGGFTTSGAGITGQNSAYLNVNQRVGYNSADLNSGVNELNRLVTLHRSECPADHLLLLGHSGGAIVVHVWVTQHGTYPNANAVLLADPKRAAGPGGPGFAAVPPMSWLPYPYSGTDNYFGSVPVLSICHPADHICNSNADWSGYANGIHGAYDFNAWDYSTTGRGVIFR